MKLGIKELSVIKIAIEGSQFSGKDCIFIGNLLKKIYKEIDKEQKKFNPDLSGK